jgi:hypothetical protein
MEKIIYFLAGPTATNDELADIAALNAAAAPAYSVHVFNSAQSPNYGAGPQDADYVAGTIPDAYSEVDEIDVDALPFGTISTASVTVQNSAGSKIVTGTASVTDGAVDHVALAATEAIVSDTGTVSVKNSAGSKTVSGTATVASGVISGVALPASEAIIANLQALVVPVTGTYATTATVTVANGVVTGIVLS